MSFDTIERSLQFGQPIKLYKFTLGSTVWRFTTADRDITTLEGEIEILWRAVPISDDGVKQTGEAITDALSITAPSTIGPVQTHIVAPPSRLIQVGIFEMHYGNAEVIATYAGEIVQIDLPTPGSARLTCETLSASMRRDGLRLAWQRTCPYALYDPITCKVDKAAHAVVGTVLGVSGFDLTIGGLSSYPDGRFAGGFIEWDDPVKGREFRAIEAHVGDVVTMFGTTFDLYPGLPVTVYRGCARTVTACTEFANLDNYGGIPHMPGRSPFDGQPVF